MKFTLSGSLEDNWLDDGWPAPFKPAVVCCGPLLLLVIRPEEGGAVKLLGLLTNATCCAVKTRDGRPAPRGRGAPRPAPRCGEGGVPRPAPPRKNDQNRGEVAGQNKGPNLNFLQ